MANDTSKYISHANEHHILCNNDGKHISDDDDDDDDDPHEHHYQHDRISEVKCKSTAGPR